MRALLVKAWLRPLDRRPEPLVRKSTAEAGRRRGGCGRVIQARIEIAAALAIAVARQT